MNEITHNSTVRIWYAVTKDGARIELGELGGSLSAAMEAEAWITEEVVGLVSEGGYNA